MKVILLIIFIATSFISNLFANELPLVQLDWNGIDVYWVESSEYPTFEMSVVFEDGAKSEPARKAGLTDTMFSLLSSGTNRYSQKQIADIFDFFGTNLSTQVNHEYSMLKISGLEKNMLPSLKMVCHLMNDAIFSKREIKKYRQRFNTQIDSYVTSHAELANRAFRSITLDKTPFAYPSEGTKASMRRLSQNDLLKRKKYFQNQVSKKIYIAGPSSIKTMASVIQHDCGWKKTEPIVDNIKFPSVPLSTQKRVHLVTVPKANQAQIRIGRYLDKKEAHHNPDLYSLVGKFLAGGFTSELIQVLRVQQGLIYSAGGAIGPQKNYGRAILFTATRSEGLIQTLKSINEVLENRSHKINTERFAHFKRFIKGRYLFSLESKSALLQKLIYYHQIGRGYADIFSFPKMMEHLNAEQLSSAIREVFDAQKLTIMVVGTKDLKKVLQKAGYEVKVSSYTKYL